MSHTPDIAELITAQCLMGRTRYLSRVLTGLYDDEVRPFGIQASQVTLLATIKAFGPVRRTDLARWLHFDSSTLTRNLRVMLANQWLEESPDGKDGRGHPIQVTEAGATLLQTLGPAWQKAQQQAIGLIGPDGQNAMLGMFDSVQAAMTP